MPGDVITLDRAVELARTGDIWVFRGTSRADRAIRGLTNAPVNHVGMAVALDDLPPLMWHAELGRSLPDMWTGKRQRGVQLHDLRAAVLQWGQRYGQRGWVRQLSGELTREHEDGLLRAIARLDGTPFPSTAALAGRWLRGRVPRLRPRRGPTSTRRGLAGHRLLRGGRRRHVRRDGPAPRRPPARAGTTPAASGAATTSTSRRGSRSAGRSRSWCRADLGGAAPRGGSRTARTAAAVAPRLPRRSTPAAAAPRRRRSAHAGPPGSVDATRAAASCAEIVVLATVPRTARQRPVQRGARFSRNAATPSAASAEALTSTSACSVAAQPQRVALGVGRRHRQERQPLRDRRVARTPVRPAPAPPARPPPARRAG